MLCIGYTFQSVLEEELAVIKSQPVPHTGVPFHPRLEHRVTVPEPFSFEERDKLTHQKREDRIQQELEEKAKVCTHLFDHQFNFYV